MGNFVNCIRYFPTQAFNLSFKDTFKAMFPKYNPKTEFLSFFGANLASGGMSAACSMTIVYPLDYARTRLASDVGSGKKSFSGLGDCIKKTMAGPKGFFGLYAGFGVSVVGIVGYRGLQLGTFDTICGLNPYKSDKGALGALTTFGAAQTAITIGAGATYPLTPSVVACRCSPRSPSRSTCTRARVIASRRSLRRRVWRRVSTKVSWPMSSAALEELWSWSSTTVPRPTWNCKRAWLSRARAL